MYELIKSGEPFLFTNMLVALITLVICAQRVHVLWFKFRLAGKELLRQVLGFVEEGGYARALQLCNAKEHPLNAIFKSALMRANRSEREIRRGVELAAIEELPKIKRGTGYMPQLANLATLLGLVGTIHGLIIAFSGVAGGDAATRQAMLSKGIAIAFYNTMFGLVLATAIIAAYMLILGKQNKLLAQMELYSAQIIDQLLLKQSSGKRAA